MNISPQTLIDRWLKSPAGDRIKNEIVAEIRNERHEAAKKIEEINARADAELSKLADKRAAVDAEFFKARAALQAVEKKRIAVQHEISGASTRLERERKRHERLLLSGSRDELNAFLDRLDAERRPLPFSEMYEAEKTFVGNRSGGQTLVVTRDNQAAIGERTRYLVAAAREAERACSTTAEFQPVLDQLLQNIPDYRLPAEAK